MWHWSLPHLCLYKMQKWDLDGVCMCAASLEARMMCDVVGGIQSYSIGLFYQYHSHSNLQQHPSLSTVCILPSFAWLCKASWSMQIGALHFHKQLSCLGWAGLQNERKAATPKCSTYGAQHMGLKEIPAKLTFVHWCYFIILISLVENCRKLSK